MKILFTLLFSLSFTLLCAQDYSATKIGETSDPLLVCGGDSVTIGFLITDLGTNGSNTLFSVTSSSADITLTPRISALSDTVIDNGIPNIYLVLFDYEIEETITPGLYTIDLTMDCQDCADATVVVSFNLNVQASPDVYIEAFPGTTVCDAEAIFLTANDSTSATGTSYLWNTGAILPFISTDTAGTYWVKSSNDCGMSSDTLVVTSGVTPIIDSTSCEITPGQLTSYVQAHDSDTTGLSFQWFENGNPIGDSLDYSITTTDSSSLLVVSSNDSVSHNLDIYTCEISNSCGMVLASSCVGILPINLVYFEGENIEGNVNLTWATASEVNNDYFEIERSVDAVNFQGIGQVSGAGTSNATIEYHYIDQLLSSSKNKTLYYRIKQVDYDGTFSYSDIININIISSSNFSINSAHFVQNLLNLNISNDEAQLIHWSLFSMDGKLLYTEKKNIPVGQSNLNYQFSDLSPGIYLISVSAKDFQKSLKIHR